jgi:hypothetical protein
MQDFIHKKKLLPVETRVELGGLWGISGPMQMQRKGNDMMYVFSHPSLPTNKTQKQIP